MDLTRGNCAGSIGSVWGITCCSGVRPAFEREMRCGVPLGPSAAARRYCRMSSRDLLKHASQEQRPGPVGAGAAPSGAATRAGRTRHGNGPAQVDDTPRAGAHHKRNAICG